MVVEKDMTMFFVDGYVVVLKEALIPQMLIRLTMIALALSIQAYPVLLRRVPIRPTIIAVTSVEINHNRLPVQHYGTCAEQRRAE